MNNLKPKISEFDFKINSLKYINNIIIIETDKGKYVYKDTNNYKIYDYLNSRGFKYFPKAINNQNSEYDLVEFIEDKNISREERLKDLIEISAVLHKSTSFNKEIDLDDIKSMYENIQNDANYLMKYYQDLNNYIDNITFMSPSEYLLVSNIDVFYYLISFAQVESTNWYNKIISKKSIRNSMIHDNLSLDHIIENDNTYLISWNKAHLDIPVFDLIKIFQNNFYNLKLEDLLKDYQKINKLSEEEYLFFIIKLSIPKRIELTNNTYLDSYNLSNYLIYLKKIASLIQKIEKNKQKV